MKNDWQKYLQEDENEEQDPRKVLDEEWEFLAKNWHMYLLVFGMSLVVIAVYVAVFLSVMSLLVGGHW